MKKYLHRTNCESEDIESAKVVESIEVDPNTYDDSNDPDDTYYSFDSVDEMLRWLNRERT